MLKAWQENEERAAAFAQVKRLEEPGKIWWPWHHAACPRSAPQVAEVNHLDDEILALHSEIVELQRSPYARRQGDKMEQL